MSDYKKQQGVETVKVFKDGAEVPDTTKRTLSTKIKPPSKFEDFAAMLKTASHLARQEGYETFEESEDFDVDDDWIPMKESEWETCFDPNLGEITKDQKRFLEAQKLHFEARFGKPIPWYKQAIQKAFAPRSKSNKKDFKKPSGDQSPEDLPEEE